MKFHRNKIVLIVFAFLAAANVAVSGKTGELGAQRWQLAQVNGQAAVNSKAFIQINEGQGRFNGNTGCNQMFGSVEVIGKRIEFSNVGTTKMICTDRNGNRQETALLRALENAKRYRHNGDSLELLDQNRVVARFVSTCDSDNNSGRNPLGDRKWVLESIANRKTFKALPYAFLNFDVKKGSVGGDTSCNVFGGEFKANGERLTITDVVSTMRACGGEPMSVERSFLDGLRNVTSYKIENGRLVFYGNKKVLLTFRGEAK
jgi:heat shock protein HslJ